MWHRGAVDADGKTGDGCGLLLNLDKEGLKFNKFYLTLKNLSKSDQVIEFYVDKNILENSKYFEKDKKII